MLELILYVLYVLATLVSIFFAWKLFFAFKHFKMRRLLSEPSMLEDLPSVSVCIPARNEKDAMTQCLEHVIASTYPKLEIIVLDDSSGDNTSILIKSFAHAGVRFVEGSHLSEGWLGKNHALQGLLDESSGTYILFMDVDTHIKPDTIGQLVSYAQQERAAMVSVLPRRDDGWRTSVLLSTMRYFWTLTLHRQSSPAVASSAWLIHRHILSVELGGIEPYKATIQPEARLATLLAEEGRYRFLISTPLLGISYEKKWRSQVDTSIRLLFPLLGNSLMRSSAAIMVLLLLNSPTIALLATLLTDWTIIQTIALWQLSIFTALYALYLANVWAKAWWLGALLWPVIVAQELVLLITSIVRYKRHRVTWKGRSVIS